MWRTCRINPMNEHMLVFNSSVLHLCAGKLDLSGVRIAQQDGAVEPVLLAARAAPAGEAIFSLSEQQWISQQSVKDSEIGSKVKNLPVWLQVTFCLHSATCTLLIVHCSPPLYLPLPASAAQTTLPHTTHRICPNIRGKFLRLNLNSGDEAAVVLWL